MRCREKEVPPVLNQKEFAALAESIEDGDINDPEELSLGNCITYSSELAWATRPEQEVTKERSSSTLA